PSVINLAVPLSVGPPQLGEILNEQNRKWYEEKTGPRQHPLQSGQRIAVAQNNPDHDQITQSFCPALEGDIRKVRPKYAHQAIEKRKDDQPMAAYQFPDPLPSGNKYSQRDRQQDSVKPAINRASLQDLVGRVWW